MARIAVGGFQHETNTFAPVRADFQAFAQADGWPSLSRGEALLPAVAGVRIPVAGAIDELRRAGHGIVPLLWCSAPPSAHVEEEAFERIAAMFLADLADADPVDGICLDLHGAMVTTHLEDGEGELLRRIRAQVGPDLPIAVSLDLHANVTRAMVAHADVMDIFRTYPHIDMPETGARAAAMLCHVLDSGTKPAKSFAPLDFMIPLHWGCTDLVPMQGLYERDLTGILRDGADAGLQGLSLACGFPLADIAEATPSVIAYGRDQIAADDAASRLRAAANAARDRFGERIWSAEEAVDEALRMTSEPGAGAAGPVVIADTQDNPGGGGPGDTTGMIRALVNGGAGQAPNGTLLGLLIDAPSAQKAHEAGTGGTCDMELGGRKFPGDAPYAARCRVLALGDGAFTATGPMWGGARMRLGPMALLELADAPGIRIILASIPMQAGDLAMFRHLGIEPAAQSIVVVKSSVHFRADFTPIARTILVAEAPGPVYADPAKLAYSRLRPGVAARPDLA